MFAKQRVTRVFFNKGLELVFFWLVKNKNSDFFFIDRFIFKLNSFFFLIIKFKDRAGGITQNELKLIRLTFRKHLCCRGESESDVFLP